MASLVALNVFILLHTRHTTIYPFLNNIKDRTHADYVKSAQTAANSHRVVDGIKGLSN